MSKLLAFRARSITTDRTGGRTRTGCEYEDFVAADEIIGEFTEENITAGPFVPKRPVHVRSSATMPFTQGLAEAFAEALVTAMDSLLQSGSISKRQLYTALNESLRDRLWQIEAVPTGTATFVIEKPSQAQAAFGSDEEDLSFSYRHESPQITTAFMDVARRFQPEISPPGKLYVDED